MPVDAQLATEQWMRYQYARDRGHLQFLEKAHQCEEFFAGNQWSQADLTALRLQRRPALTINKILSTLSTVFGVQIENRAEILFKPSYGSPAETAEALNKVWMQIAQNNQLQWVRSELFADGCIRGRGFLEVKLDFNDSMQGEVRITNLNSKNVVIDPDAEEYDPDGWNDVFTTKWVTPQDVAVMYSEDDAEYLKIKDGSSFPYGYDSIERVRDRFGGVLPLAGYYGIHEPHGLRRNIRLLDRQYRRLDKQLHFVDVKTGDMRPVPQSWDRDRIALVLEKAGGILSTTKKLVKRIRWTVTADNVVLHDAWSPYKHFTVVPYFPYFRYGRTVGLVENLLGPQELLNKVSSQELHVVNTTANSGWKIKTGTLTNMTLEELEEKGAQTGIVLEVADLDGAEKIQPNPVPTGLDRISFKSEEDIKTISGVSDSMQGFDREDVAAKAIQAKKQAGSTNLVAPMEALARTDYFLARNVLDLVQEFYTEERLIAITGDKTTNTPEFMVVNEVTPEGRIKNDLTMGEYDVVIVTVPVRDTSEDSQFEQAVALKELGVAIPDAVLIKNSRLQDKQDIIKQITGDQESPEAQRAAQRQERAQEAEVQGLEAEVAEKNSKAQLNQAKAQETLSPQSPGGADTPTENAKVHHEMAMAEHGEERKDQVELMKLRLQKEKQDGELQIKAQAEQTKAEDARIARMQQAAQAAMKPQPQPTAGKKGN